MNWNIGGDLRNIEGKIRLEIWNYTILDHLILEYKIFKENLEFILFLELIFEIDYVDYWLG